MQRGAILIAHNNGKEDYYRMAVATAKRVNQYLNLPVSVVTDTDSITDTTYTFDKTILVEPDKSNYRKKTTWINKGRYRIYELTPYDDTLVLDTDYVINSQQLLGAFNSSDFCCHRNIKWLMQGDNPEFFKPGGIKTLWATVLRFSKTSRAQQVFDMMAMVQNNYDHYSRIYGFSPGTFRNDYALTIALKTVNGHIHYPEDYFHWRLLHVNLGYKVYRDNQTSYTIMGKEKSGKEMYIKISDIDFHMLDKKNYLELIDE